ncbi:hypothetical protein SAMN02746073_2624 [Legionella jamestowniensis DSM 19215]|uniref:Uncharacterized protein n=1 Tax=Legionella jamestowniensis TaxID=455 RepID=A0A0W0UHN9_9GAMM|nr:hypothetical protein Ljam_1587 [Legionella jamestowniensis]SFL93647.1 hypothetical protein SAMN02746073_2624 [Legionella jamestowniensis DSM 19215]
MPLTDRYLKAGNHEGLYNYKNCIKLELSLVTSANNQYTKVLTILDCYESKKYCELT